MFNICNVIKAAIIMYMCNICFKVDKNSAAVFLAVPRGCLQFVIVVFPDHTHLLFLY